MIKKIDYIESPFQGKDDSKFRQFAKDIEEIIDSRIEYAELIDFPYANSTANGDLAYKARRITREYVLNKYGINLAKNDFFVFAKRMQEDGYHWYAKFDVKTFEETVKNFERE